MKTHKLVLVGVGHVGSYVLADAMKTGLFGKISLIDIDKGVARGEMLDQFHATALTYMNNVEVVDGGYEECADADIIVIAAGASALKDPANPNAKVDRTILTPINAAVIRQVMTGITEYTRDAVVILITNPLDTMVYIAASEFDYPAGKVFGTGTMLDSARLRKLIADDYKVDPKSVTAYMMGEHGFTAFPVLSKANIAGVPYGDLPTLFPDKPNRSADELKDAVVASAYDVLNSKGWTNAGVAQAAITMAKAVLLDEKSVLPACTILQGEYGYDGNVALSMPCIIGINGVERRLPVALNDYEQLRLSESAAYIMAAMKAAQTGGRN